jgi:hypothetical protein
LEPWSSNDLTLTLSAMAAVGIVVFWSLVGLRFLYDYRIRDGRIDILLFRRLPIYRVPIAEIASIAKTRWRQLRIDGGVLRFGNRLFGDCVLIAKRKGQFRRLVIPPADADAFITQVKSLQ